MARHTILPLIAILPLLLSPPCFAQADMAAGVDVGYPQLLTRSHTVINAGQLSAGVHATLVYRPPDLQFFPAVSCAYGRWRLPLQQDGAAVSALHFNYLDVLAEEYCAIGVARSRLLLSGGIGVVHLSDRSVAPSGGRAVVTTINAAENIHSTFPAISTGIEYEHGNHEGKLFYVTIGLQVQFIFMPAGSNNYNLTVTNPGNIIDNYHAGLAGTLITPGLYISLYYTARRKNSSIYL